MDLNITFFEHLKYIINLINKYILYKYIYYIFYKWKFEYKKNPKKNKLANQKPDIINNMYLTLVNILQININERN